MSSPLWLYYVVMSTFQFSLQHSTWRNCLIEDFSADRGRQWRKGCYGYRAITNPTGHLSHILKCTIQNRNVHISVLNDALWDMGQVHKCMGFLNLVFYSPYDRLSLPFLLTGEMMSDVSGKLSPSLLQALTRTKYSLVGTRSDNVNEDTWGSTMPIRRHTLRLDSRNSME